MGCEAEEMIRKNGLEANIGVGSEFYMLALLTRICKHAGRLVGVLRSSINSLHCRLFQADSGPQVGQRTRTQNSLACILVSAYFKLH
jgi:hypothetical protein